MYLKSIHLILFNFTSLNFSNSESWAIILAQLVLFSCGSMLLREVANAEWVVSIKWYTCYCFCFDRTAGILRGLIWLLPCQRCTPNWCFILFLSSYWHTKWNSSYGLLEKEAPREPLKLKTQHRIMALSWETWFWTVVTFKHINK